MKMVFFLAESPMLADAESIHIAGEFNAWDQAQHKMEKIESGWKIELELDIPPGRKEFKFVLNNGAR